MKCKIKLIVAFDEKYNIGKNNKLLWNIPQDLKLFKKFTENKIVVMGRNTFESIGKCLPNRINVLLCNDVEYIGNLDYSDIAEGKLRIYTSFNMVKDRLKDLSSEDEVFIIGGRNVYGQFLRAGLVDELYISHIKGVYEGDKKFPYINWKQWEEIKEDRKYFKDFTFKKYVKKVIDK